MLHCSIDSTDFEVAISLVKTVDFHPQMHSHMADEAILIGPPPVSQSYLKIDTIIDACKKSGAEAVRFLFL